MATTTNNENNNELITNDEQRPDEQHTTALVSGSAINESKLIHPVDILKSLRSASSVSDIEDIKSFLARPIYYGGFSLAVGGNPGDNITNFGLPDVLTGVYTAGVLGSGNQMIIDKLKGFMGIRADFKIRVMANATPFQQGLLILRFIPYSSTMTNELAMWNCNMTTKSQNHRVLLDLSCDTECELHVPFVYPAPFYNLNANNQVVNIGQVYLDKYAPMKVGTGGSSTVELSVYISMHNVELIGPTYPVAQSAKKITLRSGIAPIDDERGDQGSSDHTTSKIGKVIDIVDGMKLPMLSSFSQPLQWLKRAIDEPAAYFGFSTPLLNNLQTSIFQIDKQYWNNCNIGRIGYNLGAMSDNDVGVLPGAGGTDIDEMSLPFLTSKMAYIGKYTWDSANGPDTDVISNTIIGPSVPFVTITGTSGLVTYSTGAPITYLAQAYNYWRGSLKLRIWVVKTKFHSGRLLFTFYPGNTGSGVTGTYATAANSQFGLRTIIDIREGNVFELELPYISADTWQPTQNGFSGTFTIKVLNTLTYPSTASSTVDLILEFGGGSTFEFAYPNCNGAAPFCPTAQSGPCTLTSSSPGGVSIIEDGDDGVYYCIGEKMTTTKQLISRLQPLIMSNQCNAAGWFSFMPYFLVGQSPASAGGANQYAFARPDCFSFVGHMFALQRGSICYCIRTAGEGIGGTAGSTYLADAYLIYDTSNNKPYDNTTNYANSLTFGFLCGANQIHYSTDMTADPVFKIPFYHRNPSMLNRGFFGPSGILTNTPNANSFSRVFVQLPVAAATYVKMDRAAGDDFRFHQFVAAPPWASYI